MRALVIGPKDKKHIIAGRPGWISGPMSDLIGSVIEVKRIKKNLSIYHGSIYHGENWYWDKDWLKVLK